MARPVRAFRGNFPIITPLPANTIQQSSRLSLKARCLLRPVLLAQCRGCTVARPMAECEILRGTVRNSETPTAKFGAVLLDGEMKRGEHAAGER